MTMYLRVYKAFSSFGVNVVLVTGTIMVNNSNSRHVSRRSAKEKSKLGQIYNFDTHTHTSMEKNWKTCEQIHLDSLMCYATCACVASVTDCLCF